MRLHPSWNPCVLTAERRAAMTSPSCVRSNWGSWSDDRDGRGGVMVWLAIAISPDCVYTKTGHFQMHKLHSKRPPFWKYQTWWASEFHGTKLRQNKIVVLLKRIGDERLALGHLDHIEAARNLGVCTSFVALGTPLETFTTVLVSIDSVSQCSPYNFEKLRRPVKRFNYSSFLSTGHIRSKSSVFILQHCNTDHASKGFEQREHKLARLHSRFFVRAWLAWALSPFRHVLCQLLPVVNVIHCCSAASREET